MVKRKDGRWQEQISYTERGRVKQKYFYGSTKTEVLRKIAEWKRDEETRREKGTAFSDVADEWWEQAEEDISPNTARPYKAALNRVREHFGQQAIESITPAEVAQFVRKAVKQNNMADKTARTQLMICNLIFRYAVQAGYVSVNPVRDLEVPRNLKKSKRDIATDEDIKRVKENYDAPFGAFAYWCLYTGLRRNELLALTWENVDMEKRLIHVNKSCYRDADGKVKAKSPKTESGVRDVPVLDKLAEKIVPGTGLVFPGESGYMTNGMFERHWKHYTDASGVTCTPHQLRHAYATMLYEAGDKVSMEDAQYLLGHAQLQTTKDIYTHIRESKVEKIKNSMLSIDI
ncbi:MAG: tyrosine-type recombinase/integrase [Oscillospiraceae bacterium]|nr:tyrosine-type recombinase/integrase [Oscillospiraceae bacterium]